MDARDPAEAVEVLDLLLKFFGDGERWVRGRLSDRRGNRCLVGALDFVSSYHVIESDGAERYLADEICAAAACDDVDRDCARFRAGLRRALSERRYRVSDLSGGRDPHLRRRIPRDIRRTVWKAAGPAPSRLGGFLVSSPFRARLTPVAKDNDHRSSGRCPFNGQEEWDDHLERFDDELAGMAQSRCCGVG
jgi:hypothetical protein